MARPGGRSGGISKPVIADAAAKQIHSSVIAKNTIITPCSTVMLGEADDAEHLEHAIAREAERAEHGEHAREHDAQRRRAERLRGRRDLQILHGHVGRPLERHAAANDVAALEPGRVSAGCPSVEPSFADRLVGAHQAQPQLGDVGVGTARARSSRARLW